MPRPTLRAATTNALLPEPATKNAAGIVSTEASTRDRDTVIAPTSAADGYTCNYDSRRKTVQQPQIHRRLTHSRLDDQHLED
jgi:hypothetical protein